MQPLVQKIIKRLCFRKRDIKNCRLAKNDELQYGEETFYRHSKARGEHAVDKGAFAFRHCAAICLRTVGWF